MTAAGLRLFAILRRLPHGLAEDDLPALLPGTDGASPLRQTGLALADHRLRMLAPVREHAATKPLSGEETAWLIAYAADLAGALPQLGERPTFQGKARRARDELANVEALLQLARATGSAASIPPGPTPRDLAVLLLRVADTHWLLGSLASGERLYRQTHELLEQWAADDPDSLYRQRDLSVSWNKLGNVRQAQGDLAGALAAYEAGRAIAARLAASDPGNAGWQRDLSVSWEKRHYGANSPRAVSRLTT
jgi:tetratricopeptide (TPR) repeat protein